MTNVTAETPVSSEPCGLFFFIIYGPLFGLVAGFGLIGNSLSFAVLHKYSRNNVATYLLKALAVSDNLFLIAASLVEMYLAMALFFQLTEQLDSVYHDLQTYAWPIVHITQLGTVWMTVLVAGNRYIAVCKALHAPHLCTKRNIQLQILAMFCAIVIYNIPRYFEFIYVQKNITQADNTTMVEDVNVGLTSHHIYNILYENVSYCLFVFLFPLLILIFFNVHLVKDLKKAQQCRKALTSRSTMEENNITLVMIVIILVFIVCQTPASINQILFYVVDDSAQKTCSSYAKYYHVSNLLIIMNSSANFLIYCVFRRQFQQELCALISCKKRGKQALQRTVILRALHERTSMYQRTSNMEDTPLKDNCTDSTYITGSSNHTHNNTE